ncbi:hypothetical protein S2E19_06025 [Bacillus mycoides]|uniref:Uncharacterized protein n=1 Tax=Bacillus mycoides TaxID=1405 RepID=A0AAP8GWM3_BACMY|nr:hypothetical protein [Bacillus mycoides]MED1042627.1 hypothetical protein [Bacillus mycoides]OSY06760.1 hypothetical protein S2E19_06025 [Bacillus mycoides]PJN57675.1 hypothetical protein BAWEI_54430 [Bacillus mycoides]PJN70481.1 hypothetical protein BACWE_26610 [Bacillus mycoides]
MELTKLEIAIILGAFVQGLGEEALNNSNDSLKQLEKELDKVVSNLTLNQMKEAGESVVNKFILGLLEDKEQ